MIRFKHICCPLNRYTFSVRAVRLWVEKTWDLKKPNQ
jgi:hypothetical protein